MGERRRGRNTKKLWALILVAIAYSGWFYFRRTLTGSDILDGSIGVLLGLYISAHPAANMLDMLFFFRHGGHEDSSWQSTLLWIALNVLVVLCGWNVIFVGTTRYVSRAL